MSAEMHGLEADVADGAAGASGAAGRLLVALVAIGVVPALVLGRSLDDNRLTSWQWVLAGVDPLRLFALTVLAVALAMIAVRAPAPERRAGTALFVMALVAGACLLGEPEVIADASRYFSEAKYLEVYGLVRFLSDWGRALPAWTDLPLVPMLHGMAFAVLGESRAVAQALTLLVFAGSFVLTSRLGAELWDERTGLTAGALLLGMPYLLTQVPLLLVDVPAMFFATLAVLATVRALRRGRPRDALAAGFVLALAMLVKYSLWLLLPLVPLAAVAVPGAAPPGVRHGTSGALRTTAVVMAVPAVVVAALALGRPDVVAAQAALLGGYQAPGLGRWHESLGSTLAFQIHPFVTAAAALSVVVAVRGRDRRWLVPALPVVLLLGAGRIRYLVPAMPMLALLAGYGLHALRSPALGRAVVGCAVATSLVVALYLYLPFLERSSASNLTAAGACLDSLEPGPVRVVTLEEPGAELDPAIWVPLLDLATDRRLSYDHDEATAATKERARSSPLRFTWEFRNPPYYEARYALAGPPPPDAAVVVLSSDVDRALPAALESRLAGWRLARALTADEGVFHAKSLVRIFVRAPSGRVAPSLAPETERAPSGSPSTSAGAGASVTATADPSATAAAAGSAAR